MSDEQPELKGGHPPAQKVGGMRVVQQRPRRESEETAPKMSEEDKEEFGEDPKPSAPKPTEKQLVSGANVSTDAAFPEQAVKHVHEKPLPKHDKAVLNQNKPTNLQQQPRKQ